MTEIIKRVDGEVITEINRLHHLVESTYASTVEYAIECGRLLTAAKENVAHGEWLPWLAEHFDGSVNLAARYMRLALNSEDVAHLGSIDSALKALATPRQPREPKVSDGQLHQLLPGLQAQQTPEPIIDATVVQEPPPILDATQAGKWDTASASVDRAQGLLAEAATDGLAPPSVAAAVRDASLELRRGAKALEELSVLIEVQHRRQAA